MALSVLLSRLATPEALGLGAGAALAHSLALWAGLGPELAMGALLSCVFGARALRARSIPAHLFTLGLAFGCGAGAAAILAGFGSAELGTRVAAAITATVLAAVPLAVPADDPLAFELRELAAACVGPQRRRALRALALRRRFDEVRGLMGSAARRRMERAFGAALRLGRARQRARRATAIELLDRRLDETLRGLRRAVGAASATRDLIDGIDDAALAGLSLEQSDLEDTASAVIEVERELSS